MADTPDRAVVLDAMRRFMRRRLRGKQTAPEFDPPKEEQEPVTETEKDEQESEVDQEALPQAILDWEAEIRGREEESPGGVPTPQFDPEDDVDEESDDSETEANAPSSAGDPWDEIEERDANTADDEGMMGEDIAHSEVSQHSDSEGESEDEHTHGAPAPPAEVQAVASVEPFPKRRWLIGKQPQPLGFVLAPSVPAAAAPVRNVIVKKPAAHVPDPEPLRKPAAAARASRHRCRGQGCRFSQTVAGARAKYHTGGFCMWCKPSALTAALDTRIGRGNVARGLCFFWNNDRRIFDAAVAKLPLAERVHFPLQALKLPKTWHTADALTHAVRTPACRKHVVRGLKTILAKDEALYTFALEKIPPAEREIIDGFVRSEGRDAAAARRRAAAAAAPPQLCDAAKWAAALQHRKRALASPTAEEQAEHEEKKSADRTHARRRFFPARPSTWARHRDVELPAGLDRADTAPVEARLPHAEDESCDATGLPNAPNTSAEAMRFQDWCKHGSWTICAVCHRLETRRLKPVDMRKAAAPEIPKCKHCKSGTGYKAPQPHEQPRQLRNLSEEIVEALRPLNADPGPHERADQGYRVHTSMTRIVWAKTSVKEKIAELPTHHARKRARRALKFLLSCEASSFKTFYNDHLKFLAKQGRDAEEVESDEEQKEQAEISMTKRRLSLRFLETPGLECAIWPHLYWSTAMCETTVRSLDARRLHRRQGQDKASEDGSDDDSEDSDDDDNGERLQGRQSLKRSYLAKVLSPLIGYGTDYALFQFVYDLHMWGTLGAKQHVKGGEIPLRVLLKGASFSPLYWRLRHHALIDAQRQLGYPTMFFTMSPYEWSFPYHDWVVDELEKDLRTRLHLPAGETMHLAHALMELAQGWLTGANEHSATQDCKNWSQQILKGPDGKKIVANYCARLEFQNGKRKKPKHVYGVAEEEGGGRNWGRGAVHLHLLLWTEGGDVSCLRDVLSGTVPVEDPIMAGYVLGSQASWGASGWQEQPEPNAVHEDADKLLLRHTENDVLNGLRAYFPDITKATKGSHQDLLQADGRGLLLKYVSTYVPKFSDEFATEWLDDDLSGHHVAKKVLFDYHPQEPDMWLQLAAQHFPVFKMGGTIFPIVVPYVGMANKPDFVERYEQCSWRGAEMNLLEYLRKANKDNRPMRYIVTAFRHEHGLRARDPLDDEALEAYARDFQTRGEKVIAADTVWRMNDRYFGQWLALHVPFDRFEDLRDEEVERLVPERFYHLATALRRCPAYWREPDLRQAVEDMKLEAVNPTQIDTVIAMIKARTWLIDKYLSGNLRKEDVDNQANLDAAAAGGQIGAEGLQHDSNQELFDRHAKKLIDKAINIQSSDDFEDVERLREEALNRNKAIAVLGPPGTGKTTRAKELIRYARSKDADVLFAFPTGQMQSRLRAELQSEGLQVDIDTCHGAFALHKKEQDALVVLDDYALIVVDEFPQLSRNHFDRIIRLWESAGKVPALIFLGDFYQLPSIDGTDARQSAHWKHVHKARFPTCWRSGDQTLLGKLLKLRKKVPKLRVRNSILRNHKAWSHPGPPTVAEMRKLLRDTGGRTTIVTCTKRAAQQINELAAQVSVGRRRVLVDLPADYEVNPENFGEDSKLRTDRPPVPSRISIRRGLRVHLTKNVDKEGDFVNGMEGTVKAWDPASRCLQVKTVTGKDVAVFQYTDPSPQAQNASYFPVRLGYASTVYKMQGAELDHVTIWLDLPGQRAAAYVAMSRVKGDDDYLFGGHLTRKHFVPNV